MTNSDPTGYAGRSALRNFGTLGQPSIRSILLTIPLLLSTVSGCNANRHAHNWLETDLVCRVRIDGQPAVGVQVQLRSVDRNGAALVSYLGLADANGRVDLKLSSAIRQPNDVKPNSGIVSDYVVSIESLGDGNWEIIPPFNDPVASPLRITEADWRAQADGTQEAVIDLPLRAIRKIGR
jgi:hypothetical protein